MEARSCSWDEGIYETKMGKVTDCADGRDD